MHVEIYTKITEWETKESTVVDSNTRWNHKSSISTKGAGLTMVTATSRLMSNPIKTIDYCKPVRHRGSVLPEYSLGISACGGRYILSTVN